MKRGDGIHLQGKPGQGNIGQCAICGRADVPVRPGGAALDFHYSPPPCELPCSGGPIGTKEDHADGVHSESCPKCSTATPA